MKTLKTEIPVIIYIGYGYEESDSFTNHRQQIEKIGFYLESIFSLLKTAARQVEGEAAEASYEMAFPLMTK